MEKNFRKFTEMAYLSFIEGLKSAYDGEMDALKKLRACLVVIRGQLKVLREFVRENGFADEAEEIWFYKEQKPRFYQWQIYYFEKFALRNARPVPTRAALLEYYQGQLDYYARFFVQHGFHYQYYKLGGVELDSLYFRPNAELGQVLFPEVPEVDAAFGTPMDYLFSKFMAYERLQSDLVGLIAELERPAVSGVAVVGKADADGRDSGLRWTGEKVNLIELAHALFLAGQMNAGKTGITEFFERMGRCFEIDLGIPKRGFDDIKLRKRLSKTHFLDLLRDGLLKKIEDEDAFDPNKKKG